jgi:two-component sensor histidine kinase
LYIDRHLIVLFMIFSIFKIPEIESSNYYEHARFKLTWNLTLILLIFLPILALILFLLGENAAYPSIIGVLLCLLVIHNLKTTQKYKNSAKAFSIAGLILSQFTLNFFPEALHFVDPMWMMIISLFTFFTLGKVWGTVNLGLACAGAAYYIIFGFENNLELVRQITFEDLIALALNFIICTAIISYLIFQFIKLNNYAEQKYIKLTSALNSKNIEKSVLLKEIHHRVKNNLQVIISLLRLQSNELESEDLKTPYRDTINRVIAMSLIHEKIYQSPNLAEIDLEDYVLTLGEEMIASLSVNCDIKLTINSNVKSLKTKSLVPVALMFNELISNSIKHAFHNRTNGNISITINDDYPNVTMIYKDDGKWVNEKKANSLGLELIQSLTEQLTGSFSRNTDNGTEYSFHFVHDNL